MNLKGPCQSIYSISTMCNSFYEKLSSKDSIDKPQTNHLLKSNVTNMNTNDLECNQDRQRVKYVRWTDEEDLKLKEIVLCQSGKNWNKIADKFSNKNARQCMYRWYKVIKPSLNFRLTKEEENDIDQLVRNNSNTNLRKLAKKINKNIPSHLIKDKYITLFGKEQPLTTNEEISLLLFVKKHGTAWTKIVREYENRSENFLKNKFYSILRRKAGVKLGCEKAKLIKAKNLLEFLNETIDEYAQKLGIENFKNLYHKVFPEKCEQIVKNETTGKIEINLCNSCYARLKLNLKKKIIEKIIQKGIFGSFNFQLDLPVSSNFSI